MAPYCIMPNEVMELGCLLHYDGESFFEASLGEPMSCIVGGYYGNYHTNKVNHEHSIGVKEGGSVLIMGTTGGNTGDLKESIRLAAQGKIRPAVMVTHIGGIDRRGRRGVWRRARCLRGPASVRPLRI